MKIAIMQPYFFPYIGYFQLINAVDKFVIYDNIQYTKKGWINRNRFLQNGKDKLFSIPLVKASDYLNVVEREISSNFNKKKLLSLFQNTYAKAPFKSEIIAIVDEIINFKNENLFEYIYNSVVKICEYLEIKTKTIISSSLNYDNSLKGKEKVIEICKTLNAKTYINPIGGIELYDKNELKKHGIKLNFIQSKSIKYKQFENEFISNLSIIDVLMFNGKEKTIELLREYELI